MSELDALFSSLQPQSNQTGKFVRPTAAAVFNFLIKHLQPLRLVAHTGGDNYDSNLKPSPCESVRELTASILSKIPSAPPAAIDALHIIMAMGLSLDIDGPYLWGHLAGASSSLKTTWLDLLGAVQDRVYMTNEFTSLYSGSQTGGQNNSLYARIQNKIFIIKDLTPMLQAKGDVQNTVFGQFRAMYDGTAEKDYNNGIRHNASGVRFVVLTGVTNIIYKFQRTDMGERFLIVDIMHGWNPDGTRQKHVVNLETEGSAYDSLFDTIAGGLSEDSGPQIDKLQEERSLAWGFMDHIFEWLRDEAHDLRQLAIAYKNDRTIKAEIDALSVWVEHARCPLPGKGDDNVRAVPAEPHRLIKQLSKLAMSLSVLFKTMSPTDEVRRLVRKAAFDSGYSFSLEMMNLIASYPLQNRGWLASKMNISTTKVAQVAEHLITIGVIEIRFKPASGGVGQPSQAYVLTPRFRMIADQLGMQPVTAPVAVKPSSPASELEQLLKGLGSF